MTTAKNLELIRRLFDAVNNGDMNFIRTTLTCEFVRHDLADVVSAIQGGAATADFLQMVRRGLPDLHLYMEDILAADDRVVVRLTARGTHRGEFLGAAATGRPISFAGINIYRVADGKVAETWQLTDWAGALRQMGAALPPSATPQ